MKDITKLSGPALERAIEAQDLVMRAQVDAMIDAGRGHETMRDIREASRNGFDPQARAYCNELDKESALRDELERRKWYHGTNKPIRKPKD